jgi:hypothetical protein
MWWGYPLQTIKISNSILPPFTKRLCRNHEGVYIPTEQSVRLLSFRMRSFKVMGNRSSEKGDSFHGVGAPRLSNERFPL